MENTDYILLADGGSTKVDWVLLHAGQASEVMNTAGLNPFVIGAERMSEEIRTVLVPQLDIDVDDIDKVYFYGASCSTPHNCGIVESGISSVFEDAEIYVDHDMLGAVKALCGDHPGVACILGTGSNCCVYDGESIVDELTCLGYLAGDEGSGNYIGKMVLQSYCYGTMPDEIRKDFIHQFGKSPKEMVTALYHAEKPNAFLAQFSAFLKNWMHTPFRREITEKAFRDFIENNVRTLNIPDDYQIHFTGSVAYYFQDSLKSVIQDYPFELGNIIRKPIQGMIEYHVSHNKE